MFLQPATLQRFLNQRTRISSSLERETMMLNSDEIRRSILQGQMPDTWHIVRGSASFAILFILALWIACVVIGTNVGIFLLVVTHPSAIARLVNSGMFLLIANLLELLFFLVMAYRQARTAKDAIIVFLPEGCLEFLNISSSKPSKRSWHTVWYAQTASLRFHVNIAGNVSLNVQTHDGIHYRWVLNPYYGNRVDLAQDILIAYTTYTVLYRGTLDERTSE